MLTDHSKKVAEATHKRGFLSEFLPEGVAEVVGGVGGDDEDVGADFGQQDGQGAAASRLAHTTLTCDRKQSEAKRVIAQDA